MKPSKEDLERWREKALKATQGVWAEDDKSAEIRSNNDFIVQGIHGVNDYDLIHIVNTQPKNVLALIDLVEQEQKSYGICIDALKAIKERAKGNASLPTIIERVDQTLAAMEKIE